MIFPRIFDCAHNENLIVERFVNDRWLIRLPRFDRAQSLVPVSDYSILKQQITRPLTEAYFALMCSPKR